MSVSPSLPLVRCRDCGSGLLQLLSAVGPIDGSSIVARHCPDCGRRDLVVADELALRAWIRRDRRLFASMLELSLALAIAADDLQRRSLGRRGRDHGATT